MGVLKSASACLPSGPQGSLWQQRSYQLFTHITELAADKPICSTVRAWDRHAFNTPNVQEALVSRGMSKRYNQEILIRNAQSW